MTTINIPVERDYFITPQQIYDIISAAIEDAYDNGFINKYVFYRAMFGHMYIVLNESDEMLAADQHLKVHLSPLEYWHENLEDISKMIDNYKQNLEYMNEIAVQWIEDYIEYAYSLRGLLDNLAGTIGEMINSAKEDYEQLEANDDLKKALNIAKEWGVDREVDITIKEEDKNTAHIIPAESLFES